MEYFVGQLLQVKDSPYSWCFGIVIDVFDDKILVQKQSGGNMMIKEEYIDTESNTLIRNGVPVVAEKNFFGRFKFPKY